jgi:hypothetical protein
MNLLAKAEAGISTENLPYAMASRYNSHNQTAMIYMEAAYKAGNEQLAQKLGAAIQKDLNDQKKYYDYLQTEKEELYQSMSTEAQVNEIMLQVLAEVQRKYAKKPEIVEYPEVIDKGADSAR